MVVTNLKQGGEMMCYNVLVYNVLFFLELTILSLTRLHWSSYCPVTMAVFIVLKMK